jgi:hypothetical protein
VVIPALPNLAKFVLAVVNFAAYPDCIFAAVRSPEAVSVVTIVLTAATIAAALPVIPALATSDYLKIYSA